MIFFCTFPKARGERNYHVFYEMLTGMSQAERAKYGLGAAAGYNYLNQGGGNLKNALRDDAEEFQRLDRSLDVINFKPAEKKTIFSILAAVLHLGNVEFRMEGVSNVFVSIHFINIYRLFSCSMILQLNNIAHIFLRKQY